MPGAGQTLQKVVLGDPHDLVKVTDMETDHYTKAQRDLSDHNGGHQGRNESLSKKRFYCLTRDFISKKIDPKEIISKLSKIYTQGGSSQYCL